MYIKRWLAAWTSGVKHTSLTKFRWIDIRRTIIVSQQKIKGHDYKSKKREDHKKTWSRDTSTSTAAMMKHRLAVQVKAIDLGSQRWKISLLRVQEGIEHLVCHQKLGLQSPRMVIGNQWIPSDGRQLTTWSRKEREDRTSNFGKDKFNGLRSKIKRNLLDWPNLQ